MPSRRLSGLMGAGLGAGVGLFQVLSDKSPPGTSIAYYVGLAVPALLVGTIVGFFCGTKKPAEPVIDRSREPGIGR